MKGIKLISGVLLLGGVVFSGCASKGFVQDEIKKSKNEITMEQAKQLKETAGRLEKEISQQIADMRAKYALKKDVEQDAYNREQKIMKDVEKLIADINTKIEELRKLKDVAVEKLTQKFTSSVHILLKQLGEQKDGLERAMEELDKLIGTSSGSTPE
jgi:outer membrane murein-binding lipoprotein Lpp